MEDFGLYVIYDQTPHQLETMVKACLQENVCYLQIRQKKATDRQLLALTKKAVKLTQNTSLKIIVDDRLDVALLAGAAGVHLGQTDLSVADARQLAANPAFVVGKSTHNLEQVKAALLEQPDYLGFGPLWPTTTKENADPATGLNNLKEALALSSIPLVAIGGIFCHNLPAVLATGVQNYCLVREIMQAKLPAEMIAKIKQIAQN